MILIEAEHTLRTTAAIEVTKMNKVWYIFLRNSQDRAKKTSVLRSHTSKQYEILVNNSTHNLLQSRHWYFRKGKILKFWLANRKLLNRKRIVFRPIAEADLIWQRNVRNQLPQFSDKKWLHAEAMYPGLHFVAENTTNISQLGKNLRPKNPLVLFATTQATLQTSKMMEQQVLNQKKGKKDWSYATKENKNTKIWDFPGGPVAKTLYFQCRRTQVQSRVRELDPTRCN